MKYLTVGKLKDILSAVDDDVMVSIIMGDVPYPASVRMQFQIVSRSGCIADEQITIALVRS